MEKNGEITVLPNSNTQMSHQESQASHRAKTQGLQDTCDEILFLGKKKESQITCLEKWEKTRSQTNSILRK